MDHDSGKPVAAGNPGRRRQDRHDPIGRCRGDMAWPMRRRSWGGFGWGARMLATPACFNIPVDAEYNTQTKEIKLFIIKANAIDFTAAVKFRQLFMYIAMLPITQYQDYPIEKAAIIIKALDGFEQGTSIIPIKDQLGNEYSFGEIRMSAVVPPMMMMN